MVDGQAKLLGRRRGNLNLAQHLWLHKRLSAESFSFKRCLLLLIVILLLVTLSLMLLPTIRNVWLALGLLYGYIFFFFYLLVLTNLWWARNVIAMAKQNSLAAVGPLLDMAALTFLGKYKPASEPESPSEKKVFQYLPDLLSRMSAGDGPKLSAQQRQTLHRMVISPRYASQFDLPGLRAKIDALQEK